MKTLAELLAGGSIVEIATGLRERSERFNSLVKKTNTQTELDEMTSLDQEMEQLATKHAELKSIEDAKKRNADRMKAFDSPANPIPFPGGQNNNDPVAKKAYVPAYASIGNLKHINFGTRQENEEMAYKFFNFLASVLLPHNSPLQRKAAAYCEEHGIKTLNEGTNTEGGALVPPEFDWLLIRLIERFGLFRGWTRITPMTSDTLTRPRRTGGITATWTGESNPITASNQTYDNVTLVAKKLAAITVMSSEISEDSAMSIADEIAFEIGYAMALAEDQAGFLGDGSPTYGGITGITEKLKGLSGTIANIAGLQVATGTGYGTNYNSIVLADFNNTVAKLPQYADGPGAGWFCHRSFYFGTMQRLELAAGGVMAREVAQGDRAPRPLFLGYPVNFTQVMPNTSAINQVVALLGDLSMGSMMGDRRRRTLFTDPYSLAANDQIQVRGTERVDIVVHDVGNASGTASARQPGPIVGLITAAS